MRSKVLLSEKSSKSRDPYVILYNNFYYYCFSRDDKIYLMMSDNFESLSCSKEIVVYSNKEGLKNLWAPELHVIDDTCYIYVAADDGNNENHRMYVLCNNSSNPLDMYKNYGIIGDSSKWAIDGTILKYKNDLYFIWSGCEESISYKQELFISKMKSPLELDGEKVLISSPQYEWETMGGDTKTLPYVNEGPAVFFNDNEEIFIFYSASGCWSQYYSIGVLELVRENLLLRSSWKKYDKPLLCLDNGLIGPGHCTFVDVKDSIDEKYIIFHSFNDREDFSLNNVSVRYIKFNIKGCDLYERFRNYKIRN